MIFVLLAAASAAAPVWIASTTGAGMMISWNTPQGAAVYVVIQTGAGTRRYPLDRPSGTIVIPTPSPPYHIGYEFEASPLVTLASSGSFAPTVAPPKTTAVHFDSHVEQVVLPAPVPPRHLRTALQKQARRVELFIKVNPSGKVTGTSSPYYADALRRELARLASTTAMKRWRFQRRRGPQYRDGRIQFVFEQHRTTMRG